MRSLQALLESGGRRVEEGSFTLDQAALSTRLSPLFTSRPELLLAAYLRVLYRLQPAGLEIWRRGSSLELEALGPFTGEPFPRPERLTELGGETWQPRQALNILLLGLESSGYESATLLVQSPAQGWSYSSGEGVRSLPAPGAPRLRLSLSRAGEPFGEHLAYLREMAGYCPYPVFLQGQAPCSFRSLGQNSDLYLRVAPGRHGEFAFAANAPAMLDRAHRAFRELGDEQPVAGIRETVDDSLHPTLVRLASRRGRVGVRFLVQGVLTDPVPVETRGCAHGEIVIKDDNVRTDFTGLRVLEDRLDENLLREAGRRADEAWTTLALAYREGKTRFTTASGGFLRSDAGRVMASFVGLAIWIALLIPAFIQPFNSLTSASSKLLLAPTLLAILFGPPLAMLLYTLKNLGRYRRGEDPFVWLFHRWHELSH